VVVLGIRLGAAAGAGDDETSIFMHGEPT